ncbi:MAG: hypothetical protein L7S44_07260 [Flavobacteriaceae bacterium]|nr:hypothetical protein [Flavobacteriaceae bacterium]
MKYIYITLLSFIIISCSDNSESIDELQDLTDSQLIELIKADNNKQEVLLSEMPIISQSIISETFNYAIVNSIFHAENYGYEVLMNRSNRSLISLLTNMNIYFDNEGELLSNDFEDEFDEWDQSMCFDVEFPISVNLSDGSVVTISNEDELYEGIEEYYEMGDEGNLPEISFPINIIFYFENDNNSEYEEIVEINNYEELEMYFEMCEDEEDNWFGFDCVDLVYPVTIESPEGENFSFEDEGSLIEHIETWYDNNPDSNLEFEIVFPLTVEYFSESNDQMETLTIYSEEEMEQYIEDYCTDNDGGNWNDNGDEEDMFSSYTCGEVVFPISIEDPNGVVFNGDDEQSLWEYIDQWFIDNNCNSVDCDDDFEVVFPISITYESGNDLITMTIQSEEMLEEINEQYCED